MSACANCGGVNAAGQKFCGHCGTALAAVCPSCSTPNGPGQRFCGECGTPLTAAPAAVAQPVSERRLVSVLFVDLVGFTTASEGRDAEDTRELLSRYFDLARTLIGRYGGTVEKFIGDAVMAVWGAPVATESDAERAVRAAMDLVASVAELEPTLRARAGVLTGEAAVTVGAEAEGMVAGDLVNTASRVQSAAEPGTVLVGEGTRRATQQAIIYDDAGEHTLKGKAEAVRLWRPLRVVSGVGGTLKSAGLEAPFVGRDRELKLIKDLFHASAVDHRAHLVSVTGIGGIGKSRLVWEFYKYFDGLVDEVWWHRGRCLAYGDGVAYWALADMIRMRCRIGEDEEPEAARQKLATTLAEHVPDDDERAFVEPRLAQLLGFEEGAPADRQDLFAAWRLFFERLADVSPVVLAFEDVQWADLSLLDFIDYLLESSQHRRLFVITLGRPELYERRPGWGAGQRTFTSLYLDPLSREAMEALLEGLVPGLPDRLREQILARAEGIPLYAMETVRMLLDRGILSRDGAIYTHTGDGSALDVPETLHALIAARLDGISAEERRLVQDGAVLGKTFTSSALSALSGIAEADLEPLLSALVRKELFGLQTDPRSPERGQYGFLQDLVRHVAYETLAKRDRRTRHLAAAAHLESAFADTDEVAEVLASHYVAAVEAAPDAEDAPAIRAQAREMLARAGQRAGSLGAPLEGRRYYDQAAALAEDAAAQAALLEQSGRLSARADDPSGTRERVERAVLLYSDAGDARAAARASVLLAEADVDEGRLQQAAQRLEAAIDELDRSENSPELAAALAQLGRVQVLTGRIDESVAPLERALALAERLQLVDVFVEALASKGVVFITQGRLAEARILFEAAAARAHDEHLYSSELRAMNNLGVVAEAQDRFDESIEILERMLVVARRRGDRRWESLLRTGAIYALFLLGRWDEGLEIADAEAALAVSESARMQLLSAAQIHVERGEIEAARALLSSARAQQMSEAPETVAGFGVTEARLLRAEGRPHEALVAGQRAAAVRGELDVTHLLLKMAFQESVEALLEVEDLDAADELLSAVEGRDPGQLTPFLQASTARLRARLEAARGAHETVDSRFRNAAARYREFGFVFHQAICALEHAEWLLGQGRRHEAEPLLAEASETFARLRATPWLERLRRHADRLQTA